MEARFRAMRPPGDAVECVLLAVDAAAAVMLEEPQVNRAVMSWLGAAGPASGRVWARSTSFWTLALGSGEGLAARRRGQALACLPRQLAFGFRGVLSFWTAGELLDEELAKYARGVASTMLLGFGDGQRPSEPVA